MRHQIVLSIAAAIGLCAAAAHAQRPEPAVAEPADPAPARDSAVKMGVDRLLLEFGAMRDTPKARQGFGLRSSAFAFWQPTRQWDVRLGARIDGDGQSGGSETNSRVRADIGDTFVRYRSGDTRLTVGAQTIIWGRVDAVPLIDRVSRVDLRRFALDDLADRRLPQPALRWEQEIGEFKLDTVVLPTFRAAKLPLQNSVWSPFDLKAGRVLGLLPDPALSNLARISPLQQDDSGHGGAAIRLTRTGEPVDFGLTLARTRQPTPYLRVNPLDLSITAIQPYNGFAAVDAEFVTGSFTWRTELARTQDVPVTTPAGEMKRTTVAEWVGGVEFYPGGKNTRVNLQLAARSVRADFSIRELKRYVGVNGEVEATFDQARWKASMRFASGINIHDLYLAPKLSYVGWEPHELFVTARVFRGNDRSFGGFYRDNNMIAVGLKTKF